MPILLLLVLVIEFFAFIIYGIFILYDIKVRKEKLSSVDYKMLNTGRILSWIGILGIIVVSRNSRSNFYLFFILINIVQVAYYIGFRLEALSYSMKEENKGTFYYHWDRWLEKMYRKYLEPLWKEKK